MATVRFIPETVSASCVTCVRTFRSRKSWRPTAYGMYIDSQDAVPLCARHALFELAQAWMFHDITVVDDTVVYPPIPQPQGDPHAQSE